jgi:hypothetical protein
MTMAQQHEMIVKSSNLFIRDRIYEFHNGGDICMSKCYEPTWLQTPADDDPMIHEYKEREKRTKAKECADLCLKQFGTSFAKAKTKFEYHVQSNPSVKDELLGDLQMHMQPPGMGGM